MPLPAILLAKSHCCRQSINDFPPGNPKMFHFWREGHCPSPTMRCAINPKLLLFVIFHGEADGEFLIIPANNCHDGIAHLVIIQRSIQIIAVIDVFSVQRHQNIAFLQAAEGCVGILRNAGQQQAVGQLPILLIYLADGFHFNAQPGTIIDMAKLQQLIYDAHDGVGGDDQAGADGVSRAKILGDISHLQADHMAETVVNRAAVAALAGLDQGKLIAFGGK